MDFVCNDRHLLNVAICATYALRIFFFLCLEQEVCNQILRY